jgi:hypothetical protein
MPRPDKVVDDGYVQVDPAAYEHTVATPDRPSYPPDGGLDALERSLEQAAAEQIKGSTPARCA